MDVDIDLISTLSILAPTIVGAIFYRKLAPLARVLFWFVFVTFVLEGAVRVYYELGWNNMFLFHLYSFIEVAFICLIYRNLSKNPNWRTAIVTAFVIFQTVSIVNLLFFEDLTHFNSVQRYVEMVIIYALLSAFLLKAIDEPFRYPLRRDPAVLLTLGFMIYFLGTLFLFIYADQILSSADNKYWIIHGIFNVFLNAVYTLVFYRARMN